MGWLGRVLTKRAACCFCGQRDSVDALEAHKYCRYYYYTKRYYHESCLQQVLNHPEKHSANDVDTALELEERRRERERALRAEEKKRRKRLAKLELLECPYCGEKVDQETCAGCGAPMEVRT